MSDHEQPILSPPNGNVEFQIGGHAFKVPYLSLLDVQRSGMKAPLLKLLSGGQRDVFDRAEEVIDVLGILLTNGSITRDVLMLSCSLGEAIQLPAKMDELLRRSDMPIAEPAQQEQAPTPEAAPEIEPAPITGDAADPDLAIPPRPTATLVPPTIVNFPSASQG